MQPVLRRCINNIEAALTILARPARGGTSQFWPMTWQQFGIGAGVALAIFLFIMIFFDAALIRGVAHLPHWIVWFFNQITDYGKSGWFLWPLGFLFVALAALPPMLPRATAIGAGGGHGARRLPVRCHRLARPVRHHHQAHDRPRRARW